MVVYRSTELRIAHDLIATLEPGRSFPFGLGVCGFNFFLAGTRREDSASKFGLFSCFLVGPVEVKTNPSPKLDRSRFNLLTEFGCHIGSQTSSQER